MNQRLRVLVTGATGFVGSHVVESLLAAGNDVRALARPTSDTRFLESTTAEIVRGDLSDPTSLRRATDGCGAVVHTAALVGEWAPWDEFFRVGVQGTRNLFDAAVAAGARRAIHLSSIAVYGSRLHGRTVHEYDPYDDRPEPWNHYVREKVQSERLALHYQARGELEVTAIRPSVIWGSRDRAAFPRTRALLFSPLAGIVGKGSNRVPSVSVRDVADVCRRALETPAAAGRAYNVSSDGAHTQLDLLSVLAECSGAKLPRRHLPFAAVMKAAVFLERSARLLRRKNPPVVTRFNLLIIASDVLVDTTLARAELGWREIQPVPDAIREAAASFARDRTPQTAVPS